MAIVLNGNTGIQNVLGSASAPAESNTTSSNTGLYFPTSTTLGLSTNGTAALTIDASQNVGIGTTSPANKLQVQSGNSTQIRVSDVTGTYYFDFGRNTSDGLFQINGNQGFGYKWLNNGTEAMRIDSSGNVGIGTTSPSASLSVVKQTTALSGTGNSYGLYMYPTSSGLTYIDAITSSTGNTSLGFRTYNNGTYNEMRMDSSGNVGIGTSSPGANSLTLASKVIYMSSGYGICWDSTANQIAGYNTNILQFITSSSERMRIDANGNLLVNRTTVSGLAGTSGHIVLNDSIPSGTLAIGGFGSFLGRQASDGSTVLNTGQGSIIFSRGSYGSTSEAMRIDSSNNLLVGTTNTNPITARANGFATGPVGFLTLRATNNMALGLSSTSGTHISFYTDNGSTYVAAGNIGSNGSSTSYNTSSDYRLKENIAFLLSGIETIQKLRPVSYTWREGYGNGNGEGFIAHELAEHIPLAVTGEKDAVDDEGNIKPQGVDYSKIVVHLVAAVQELSTKVDAQAAEIAALKGTK